MIKHILSITGLIFVAVALGMSMTNYGKDVTDTYEKCSICLKEGVESVCDCQIVEVYGGTPELFWVFWGVGTAFTVIGFLYRQ